MTKEDVLTAEGVADILGVSKNTVHRRSWREKTGCPLRKKGKRLYCLSTEFSAWMKN
jgi:hypothetical protein